MIKEAIVKIVNKEDLTYDEAYTVMNEIMSRMCGCHESTCDSCGDRNGIV